MLWRSGKAGNYAYTVARVKAKKSLLLGEEDYNKMLMMSVLEISRYISENGYQKEMAELANRENGIDLVERATYQNMASIFKTILNSSQGQLQDMLTAYLRKWDYWNIKVILRGKIYGLNATNIREDLVPAGDMDIDDMEALLSLTSIDEVLSTIEKLAHMTFPAEILSEYKSTSNLGIIEDYLDIYRYEVLLASIGKSDRPFVIFRDTVRKSIDTKNYGTIMKLKAEGIYGEAVLKYMIPGGKLIDEKLITQLANAETLEAALADSTQLEIYDSIKEAIGDSEVSISAVMEGLCTYTAEQTKKFSHLYPLSVIPVMDYMIHKENEVRNIRLIARGIESNMNRDKIKELLVI